MSEVGGPLEGLPGVLGGVMAGEEDGFLGGEGRDLASEDFNCMQIFPEEGGLQRVKVIGKSETPMNFEDVTLRVKRELNVGLHEEVLLGEGEGGVGNETGMKEESISFGEILRADEQVKIGELTE